MNGFVMFPSPIGELHFSIHSRIILKHWIMVSVPYRGATFLNRWLTSLIKVFVIHVSVPYRGATFLNDRPLSFSVPWRFVSVPYRGATFLNLSFLMLYQGLLLFPSPIGELHFSIPSPQPHVLSGTDRGIAGEK